MHPDKFGDSYDIVKQRILEWLRPCGTWAVHPMFSKDFDKSCLSFAEEYEAFLDSGLLTTDPVPPYSGETPRARVRWNAYLEERCAYFCNARQWGGADHLFLDPDTGLWLPTPNAKKRLPDAKKEPQYLMAEELRNIAIARPNKLTLVFDQSFSRNLCESDRRRLTQNKLRWFEVCGVWGIAYFSHANFVLVSKNYEVLDNARRILLDASKLPHHKRLVEI